jgi:hypothetical protein
LDCLSAPKLFDIYWYNQPTKDQFCGSIEHKAFDITPVIRLGAFCPTSVIKLAYQDEFIGYTPEATCYWCGTCFEPESIALES